MHKTIVNNLHLHAGMKTYVRSSWRKVERARESSQSYDVEGVFNVL